MTLMLPLLQAMTWSVAVMAYAVMCITLPLLMAVGAMVTGIQCARFVIRRRMIARRRAALAFLDVLSDVGVELKDPQVRAFMREHRIGPEFQEDGE